MAGSRKLLLGAAAVLVVAYIGSGFALELWARSLIKDAARAAATSAAGSAATAEAQGIQPWTGPDDSRDPDAAISPLHAAQTTACDGLSPIIVATGGHGCGGLGTHVDASGATRITYVFEPWYGLPFEHRVQAAAAP